MEPAPKYSLPEIERRWLASPAALAACSNRPCRLIEDRYILGGHLRLRRVHDESDGKVTLKLGKKYERQFGLAQPLVSVYLSQSEHEALASLPAASSRKRRHLLECGALDVYEHPAPGLLIFEVEFLSEEEASSYHPPSFAVTEVTANAQYSGFSIARSAA